MIFLECTVTGTIPHKATTVTKVTKSTELFRLESIARVQPLVKGDSTSPCLITFVDDVNMPRARMVLEETFGNIVARMKSVIL